MTTGDELLEAIARSGPSSARLEREDEEVQVRVRSLGAEFRALFEPDEPEPAVTGR